MPTQNYYVLTPLAATANASNATATGASGIVVFVEQAHLPDVIDRPQMIVSQGNNEVTILEQQRWAEPLRAAIPQVIAQNLASALGGARVSTSPQTADADGAWRLSLDVQRFESRPAESAAVDIAWTLQRRNGAIAETRSGRSTAREAVAGGSYDAIAAAHSKALATISREIAAALRTSSTAQTPR